MGGEWKRFNPYGECFDYEIVEADEYNLSENFLSFKVRDGSDKGGILFDLAENGIEPIQLSSRTRVAWCWKATKNTGSNGIWIILIYEDTLTGRWLHARCNSWSESTYDVIRTYYEPTSTWVYHDERVGRFVMDRMADPDNLTTSPIDYDYSRIVLTGIAIGASRAGGMAGGIDNIWVGENDPPETVDVIDPKQQVPEDHFTRIRAFSYGYVDADLLPDRVDVFRDRIEVRDGREAEFARYAVGVSGSNGVRERERDLLAKVKFNGRRNPSAVSIVDIDGNRLNDILVQFDDRLGQVYFRNDLIKGRFAESTKGRGMLKYNRNRAYGVAPADIDGDGDLDLALFNPIGRRGKVGGLRLIRNEGFFFRPWTRSSGISSFSLFGGAFGDLDGDGDQDFFAAFRTYDVTRERPFESRVFINDGKGRFEGSRKRFMLPDDLHIEGAVIADFDNDADLDIYVVVNEKGFTGDTVLVPNILYMNDGRGYFTDVSSRSTGWPAHMSESAVAEDFDHDGDVDIIEVSKTNGSVYYRNEGGLRFTEIEHVDFTREGAFEKALAVDYDHDGDMDLVLLDTGITDRPVILPNGSAKGGFFEVTLRGIGNNKSGIGSKIYLYESGHLGEQDYLVGFREIQVQKGFGPQAPPMAHFGIDTLETVDLRVVFPPVDGGPSVVIDNNGVDKNSFIWIVETDNLFLSWWYSYRIEQFKYSFVSLLFRIPAWLMSFLLLGICTITGLNIRARRDTTTRMRLPHRMMPAGLLSVLVIVMILVIPAAFFRSWLWAVPVFLISLLLISTDHDLVGLFGRLSGVQLDREMQETLLIKKISLILHPEGEFRFLDDFKMPDAGILDKYRDSIEKGLDQISICLESVRHTIPGEQCWKDAASAFSAMGETIRAFYSSSVAPDNIPGDRISQYNRAIERFNDVLRGCRMSLRARHRVDLVAEWDEFISGQRGEVESVGIELSEDLTGIVGEGVYLTPDEFRHIFGNLLTNSIWAVSAEDEKRIRIEASSDRMHVEVRWLDSGCGIPPGMKDELFIRDVRSRRPGGRGLGCHNIRQIMDSRQGFVFLDDAPGGWSTMVVVRFVRNSQVR